MPRWAMDDIIKTPHFFHDKPLFGLDIGHGSLKVMQVDYEPPTGGGKKSAPKLIGYGFAEFSKDAINDGVITNPVAIAEATQKLFKDGLVGDITTRRVALAIPAYRTFTRAVTLPKLKPGEIAESIQLEAEQYISTPLDELYLDYEIVREDEENTEVFMVAVPREIVDSQLELTQILGLEPVLVEPTLASSGRLFDDSDDNDLATMIIDLGSQSQDISIFDKHVLVTGTVKGGGEDFSRLIMEKLNVSPTEAQIIKTRYGLGASKRQAEIKQALDPILTEIVKEIRRMFRYYEERYGSTRPVGQIVTLGGGANIPGFSEYLIDIMRIPVKHTSPWHYFDFKGLDAPGNDDKPMYATVAGLSLAQPKEVFRL